MTITIQDQVYEVETEAELLRLLPQLVIYAFKSEHGQNAPLPDAHDILDGLRHKPARAWQRVAQ